VGEHGYSFNLKLAHALVEHETLNGEEVQRVIKGEAIRTIGEALEEEISKVLS